MLGLLSWGHSDRQGLRDDRIQQQQKDFCSYLQGEKGKAARLLSLFLAGIVSLLAEPDTVD